MSLVELLVATGVFLIAIIGVLYTYAKAIEINSIGQGAVVAIHAAKNKIEEIKGADHSAITSTYNNTSFAVAGINGRGVIYVDPTNSPLLRIKVVVCWKLSSGRVIGEDVNLNGVLNAGEDTNGNSQLDSYVQIVTELYG